MTGLVARDQSSQIELSIDVRIGRSRIAVAIGAIALLIIGLAVGLAIANSHASAPPTAQTCSVPAGVDAPVIQAAMKACANGGTVSLAAGTYDLTNHMAASYPNEIITGAGQTQTFLVQHSRVNIWQITAPGVTIENMSVDTGTWNPGVPPVSKSPVPATIFSNQSHTSIINVSSKAGTGFGMRITGPSPCDAFQTLGTVVTNVDSTNTGSGGFTALDIDCTNGAQLTNITITGDYIAFYQDENVVLNGEAYTPDAHPCQTPAYVSGPSNHLLLENITGGGAVIAKASKRGPVTFLTITNDVRSPGC
jgi:hypothetical protein